MSTKTTRPSKQRKRLYQAPLHRRRRGMSATLSERLREDHGCRAIPVRVGDTVKVMRGDFNGHEGPVIETDVRKYRVYIEKATVEKVDGTQLYYPIHPSKIMITKLNLDDEERRKILGRRG